jgi:hypothetical protein
MRQTRILLSLLIFTGPATSAIVACGSDDPNIGTSSSSGAIPDASTGVDSAPPTTNDAATTNLTAVAQPVTVYFGQGVTLDGSGSTGPAGFTYAWTVVTAPPGSGITTAALTGAATAKPSFVPDRPGAYSLKLTVTAGSATVSTDVPVNVVDPPIFYLRSDDDAGTPFQASINVVGAGAGDGGTAVSCFNRDAGSYAGLANMIAMVGSDWWEAPAGQASRAVFVSETRADGGATALLTATTSDATCASQPTTLDAFPGEPGSTRSFEQPRLSPAGDRVVYMRAAPSRIATVGFDGSSKRLVSPLGAYADGGSNPNAAMPPLPSARPIWVNATTVAWLQALDATHWQIVSAPDQENTTPTLVMSCTGVAPTQFDILPSGEVLVSQSTGAGNAAVVNLLAYPIGAVDKACGAPRNLSNLTSVSGGSVAQDFSVSPDKTRVAYTAVSDADNTHQAMVAFVAGASAPVAVAAPLDGAYRGPRWVGAGAFITWGARSSAFDAGLVGNAVAVVSSNGGQARVAASGPNGTTTQAISNGIFTCGFAPAVGSSVSLFGFAGLIVLRLARRRRR